MEEGSLSCRTIHHKGLSIHRTAEDVGTGGNGDEIRCLGWDLGTGSSLQERTKCQGLG